MKEAGEKTRDAASSAGRSARSAGHAVGDYSRSAGSKMRSASSAMSDYSHTAADSMRQYGRSVSDGVGRGVDLSRERFDNALEEKPLVVGLAAMAAGLLAGFVLPHTRTEDRMCGRTSDRLKDEARRRGEEVLNEGKDVAMHVADTALGDAEGQGLTPGSLGDKVARVAKDVVHAAKESAEREGIDPQSLGEKAKHVGQAVKEKGKKELDEKKSRLGVETDDTNGTSSIEKKSFEDKSSVLIADSGAACSIGSPSTATSSIGGLSDDMSSVKDDADLKDDIATGMSQSSSKTKARGADSSGCECG
jgi:hypothetical protein